MIEEPNRDGRRFSLKPVITPLPSRTAKPWVASDGKGASAGKGAARDESAIREAQIRDIAEDDDGYHPYADVPDTRPLFEENPWD